MADSALLMKIDWKSRLRALVPLYGHRNWIVVADSAYPLQSSTGIQTLACHDSQFTVLGAVLSAIRKHHHVKPVVYTDAELQFVDERDAPGVSAYRKQLAATLGKVNLQVLPHEQIIAKLDKTSAMYEVTILKTDLTIPYTSVFLELDCRYWNANAEKRLRDSIAVHSFSLGGPEPF